MEDLGTAAAELTTEGTGNTAAVSSPSQCWAHLARVNVGRVAVRVGEGVDIFPINFTVHSEEIYFRTAPGSKLMDIATNPVVAFEADGGRAGRRWSVVVKGRASRIDRDDVIESSGVLRLQTETSTEKWNYVRIAPTSITGRQY